MKFSHFTSKLLFGLPMLDQSEAEAMAVKIEGHYSEPHRFYHNNTHIHRTAMHFMGSNEFLHLTDKDKRLGMLAIVFHDIIYVPGNPHNEAESAYLACDMLSEYIPFSEIDIISDIILETTHKFPPTTGLAAHVMDADIFELGDCTRYYLNGDNIRKEFSMYTNEEWNAGRATFLESMLAKEQIFYLPSHKELESWARVNMTEDIKHYGKNTKT